MKPKSMVLLAVAVACGLVAMLGVQQLVSNGNAAAEEEVLVRVLTAAIEVAPRTPLDDTNTEFKDLPEDSVPEGAVTDLEQVLDLGPKSTLYPGDVVTLGKLTEDKRPSIEIPKGMRVVTVSVNLTKTHSGLITPGDYVDLQVTYQARSPEYGLITKSKTFMQNIEVFATDNVRSSEAGESDDIKAKNISLLVTPRDANLLKLAESLGDLHLVLRGKDDVEETEVEDFDMRMLDEITGSVARRDNSEGRSTTARDEHDEDPEEGDGDVRNFLANVDEEPDPAPVVRREPVVVAQPAVEEPQHEVWHLEIRAGEETINEEILIPIETSANGSTEPGVVEATTNGVVSTLKRVLNNGGESRPSAVAPSTVPNNPAPEPAFTEPTLPETSIPESALPEGTEIDEESAREAFEAIRERLGDFEDGRIPEKLLAP